MRSQVDHCPVSGECAEPNCQTEIKSGELAFYYPDRRRRILNQTAKELEVSVMYINKAIVVGNLGRDPEVRALPSGQNVANFSVATKARFKDRNGEQQERTEWHRIVAFEKLADIASASFPRDARSTSRDGERLASTRRRTGAEPAIGLRS
jgi:hypothetical protein